MKKYIITVALAALLTGGIKAQDLKTADVPAVVKAACMKKFPEATKMAWEKENGDYEANWGGKSGEDNSAMFTPAGAFIQIVKAIPVSQLPKPVMVYIKANQNGATIKEAGRVTDATGKITYEAEIKGKDLIFDENGKFLKAD